MPSSQTRVSAYFKRNEWKPLYYWERAKILRSLVHLNDHQHQFLKKWASYYIFYRDHPRDPQNIRFWRAMDNIANRFFIEVGPSDGSTWRRAKVQFYKRWLKRHLITRWDARIKNGRGLIKLVKMIRTAAPASSPNPSRESSPACVIPLDKLYVTF
ncbi:hypothetical protein VNI00_003734 [Paramarasmius palmivorus]|uniref:Uncharacterized protein n=1 Tax=Paramarasmius palmivorus TaxID=297713 RepID=A0AAW0DRL2_9AGAR